MHHVYLLRDAAGRHYLGMTSDLAARLKQHRAGSTQTTRRMKGDLLLVACRPYATRGEAAAVERKLKSWKHPAKAEAFLKLELAG